jgi:hypothetical protein
MMVMEGAMVEHERRDSARAEIVLQEAGNLDEQEREIL